MADTTKEKVKGTKKRQAAEDTLDEELKSIFSPGEDDTLILLRAYGIYYISGEIETGSLQAIHRDILLKYILGKKCWDKDITLIINSPGGQIDESHSLLDLLSNLPFDVRTVGLGDCSSAAAELLAAGTKGKRIAGPHTTIMIHSYSWGGEGKHAELVAARRAQDILYDQQVKFWLEHSKYTTVKQVEKYLLKKEDNYMSAQEALEHGIIDKISTNFK